MPLTPRGILEGNVGVLSTVQYGGTDRTFAKQVESFFELSIITAPSFHEGRGNEPK